METFLLNAWIIGRYEGGFEEACHYRRRVGWIYWKDEQKAVIVCNCNVSDQIFVANQNKAD